MFKIRLLLLVSPIIFFISCNSAKEPTITVSKLTYVNVLTAGEVKQSSAILHARFGFSDTIVADSVPGSEVYAGFQVATDSLFANQINTTEFKFTSLENDFTRQQHITDLKPGVTYFYRAVYKQSNQDQNIYKSKIGSFVTPNTKEKIMPASFVMVTGSHFYRFVTGGTGGGDVEDVKGATVQQAKQGFPALEVISNLRPDYYIGNGDNVYYDHPHSNPATSVNQMRQHWQRFFSQQLLKKLFRHTATYWLKDDHDFRWDDADTTNYNKKHGQQTHPTVTEGIEIFKEQVPVIAPQTNLPPYRTIRFGKLLELWFVDVREFRSPNATPDGPNKTAWGEKQKIWLKQTLLKSDATFKLLVSPTPMIGPDDASKIDNHTNIGGFRYERDSFFNFLLENNLPNNGFYIVCGDRHWQYHSQWHIGAIEEYSCGALVDQNARLGRIPGDSASSDPNGLIKQPYCQPESSGGFLWFDVAAQDSTAVLTFKFFDDEGKLLYSDQKTQPIQ